MGYMSKFCWHDLVSTDLEASKAFFTQLFGWTANAGPGGDDHLMLANGEATFGGLSAAKAGQPSHWMGYIGVTSVDETVDKARRQGANIALPGQDIPGAGRFAIMSDPQGALFAVYQGLGSSGDDTWSPETEAMGAFGWAELGTTDVDGAKGFYGESFNWTSAPPMEMPDGQYHMLMLGEEAVGGLYTKPAEQPMSAWMFYVNVENADASVAQAKSLGGNVIVEATSVPDMIRFAILTDPTGAVFGIAQSLRSQS